MPRTVLAGSRIRDIRTAKQIKQVDLAHACGISPSYLNLIEHNRRRIGGALLLKIAASLEVDASNVSEGADASLATALDAAAEARRDTGAETERLEELASRFPGWARLVAAQYDDVRRLEQVVERMGDRLTHDPYLSASMHNVLSSVTAIRSASAILASGEKVEPEWQARFHRNIYEDSQRLADATETLVTYLDSEADGSSDGALPQEEVDRWLSSVDWHVAALEDNPETMIGAIVDEAEGLRSTTSKTLAHRFLEQYAADAKLASKNAIMDALSKGAIPGQIATSLGVSLPLIFRRLASLCPDDLPGANTFGLVGCDGSGTLVYRKPVPGFELPSYSGACPLWPLFQALQQPMVPVTADLSLIGRDEGRFSVQAVAEVGHPMGYDRPAVLTSWMLIRERELGLGDETARRVGTTCRICAELDCHVRREPSVFSSLMSEAL